MVNKLIKCCLFTGIVLCCTGCYLLQSDQHRWHKKVLGVYPTVMTYSYLRNTMDRFQLEGQIGPPDYVMSPPELAAQLATQHENEGDRIMDEIWTCFTRRREDMQKPVSNGTSGSWEECKEFQALELLMYDESSHFKKSIVYCGKIDDGFSCYIYIVEKSRVIGATTILDWKPLKMPEDN